MGIGISLASGLVKGFTQNIALEMERRKAERDRIAQYDAMVFEAMMKDPEDVNAAGINAARGLVQAAKGQLDKQEAIDIFGTRGKDIDLDIGNSTAFDSVLEAIEAAASDDKAFTIGNAQIPINENYFDLKGDAVKGATMRLDALSHLVQTEGDRTAFMTTFNPMTPEGVDNYNALRRRYRTDRQIVLSARGQGMMGEDNPLKITTDVIPEYNFFSDFLRLNSDADALIEMEGEFGYHIARVAQAEKEEGAKIDPKNLFALPVDLVPGTEKNRKYGVITRDDLIFNLGGGDDAAGSEMMDNLEGIANYQGRDLRIVLHEFGKGYKKNQRNEFFADLKNAASIYGLASRGTGVNFVAYADDVGAYFEENNVSSLEQLRSIRMVMGSVLSKDEQKNVNLGLLSKDDFRKGNSVTEGFQQAYGGSGTYKEFTERLAAARRAKGKLEEYFGYINNITTVKDSFLDRTIKLVNSFIGDDGQIDQIIDLLRGDGPFDEGEEAKIRVRLAQTKAAGLSESEMKARRDTLAFIIAADMARAEDSQGRLSDGDLLRNLQKLSSTSAQKGSERNAVMTVIEDITKLEKELADINGLMIQFGTNGFDLDLQERLRALQIRDEVMAKYTANMGFTGNFGYQSLKVNPDFTTYNNVGMTNAGYQQVKDGDFEVIMENDGKRVVIYEAGGGKKLEDGDRQVLNDYFILSSAQPAQAEQPEESNTAPLATGDTANVDGKTLTVTKTASRPLTDTKPIGSGTTADYQQSPEAAAATAKVDAALDRADEAAQSLEEQANAPKRISSLYVKAMDVTEMPPDEESPDGYLVIKDIERNGKPVRFKKQISPTGELDYVEIVPNLSGDED
tara:strand:+ start:2451 stop:4997 length:2547 start_codon:yes stop_codon:yes gene_type:complete